MDKMQNLNQDAVTLIFEIRFISVKFPFPKIGESSIFFGESVFTKALAEPSRAKPPPRKPTKPAHQMVLTALVTQHPTTISGIQSLATTFSTAAASAATECFHAARGVVDAVAQQLVTITAAFKDLAHTAPEHRRSAEIIASIVAGAVSTGTGSVQQAVADATYATNITNTAAGWGAPTTPNGTGGAFFTHAEFHISKFDERAVKEASELRNTLVQTFGLTGQTVEDIHNERVQQAKQATSHRFTAMIEEERATKAIFTEKKHELEEAKKRLDKSKLAVIQAGTNTTQATVAMEAAAAALKQYTDSLSRTYQQAANNYNDAVRDAEAHASPNSNVQEEIASVLSSAKVDIAKILMQAARRNVDSAANLLKENQVRSPGSDTENEIAY